VAPLAVRCHGVGHDILIKPTSQIGERVAFFPALFPIRCPNYERPTFDYLPPLLPRDALNRGRPYVDYVTTLS